MDKLSNKPTSKLKKVNLNNLNLTNDLNMNLINNLNNQTNGNLPPDIFNLNNLNDLNNSLNQLNSLNNFNNANQYDHLINNHHLANQLNTNNKNAITSEFTSQSLLYPNFYQQQCSKLTLSSNHFITPPPPPPPSNPAFNFHPFITAAVQNSMLNNGLTPNNFFHNHHLNSQQQQSSNFNTSATTQQLMMQSLNNLNSLGSLNNLNQLNTNSNNLNNGLTSSLNNLTAFNDYLNQKPDFNMLNNLLASDHLNHFNQLNKNLTMLNESFLTNSLSSNTNYQTDHQLSTNDFNFSLNKTSNKVDQKLNKTTTSPSNQIYKQPKRQKLDSKPPTMHDKFEFGDKFNLDLSVFTRKYRNFVIDDIKEEDDDDDDDDDEEDIKLKNKLKEFEELTKELKVQTNDEHIKLEEKKFSPDSSTEFNSINKKKSPINHHLSNINNQSPIVTSTKSSEHSSPDIPLNSSLNTLNSLNKEFIKEEEEEDDEQHEELSCNELKIDESKDLEAEEDHDEKCNLNEINKKEKFTETEDLYNLISKKSFQPIIPSVLKDVSLDRMSFDEDEEDDDNNSININFSNLIDNELRDSKDDELINNRKINNKKSKRSKDEHSTANQINPYVCIRRSERIFFNEVMNTNSNKKLDLDENNKDFKLSIKDLEEPKRILIEVDELLYSGLATKDELTGKFCISLDEIDCPMNNQVFTYDELIRECLSEIKPKSIDQLYEGCRVCAFWTPKTKCLYPGKVNSILSTNNLNSSTSSLTGKKELIPINFDDGDCSKIALNDIRLLPQDFKLKKADLTEKEDDNNEHKDNESLNNKQIEIEQNDKKVQKLKIKLNNNNQELIKKKKKKSHRSKEEKHHRRHRHHKRKYFYENEENNSADSELNNDYQNKNSINYDSDNSDSDLDKNDDEWYMKLNDLNTKSSTKNKSSTRKNRSSDESELFIPEKPQLWRWHGKILKRIPKVKPKKIYYSAIIRDEEIIKVNDCAIFQSTNKSNLPYVGRIVSMWQNSQGNMIVRIKWFYHHEELELQNKPKPKLLDCKGALFESFNHYDDNDVQCIKNKCLVLEYDDYLKEKKEMDNNSDYESDEEYVYYLSGVYNPLRKKLVSLVKDVPLRN